MNTLATNLASYLATDPSDLSLTLKTHLTLIKQIGSTFAKSVKSSVVLNHHHLNDITIVNMII